METTNRDAFKTMKNLIQQTQSTPMICVTDFEGLDRLHYHYIVAQLDERSVIEYCFEIHHGNTNLLIGMRVIPNSIWEELTILANRIQRKSPYAVLSFYAC